MANTLTGLIPTIYEALDTVSRELVGFVGAVSRDSSAERAAKDQTVRSPVAPAATTENIVPDTTPDDSGNQTIGYVDMTISSAKAAPIRWSGEEELSIRNGGQYERIIRDQFTQAMRALVNEVEADLAALYVNASRAYGAAGTTPFAAAGELDDIAEVMRILEENGAPTTDLRLVLGTAAIAKLRGYQSSLFKVNEAGTPELLRNGTIAQLMGFGLHTSAQVKRHTKGTANANYDTNCTGGLVAGTTIIPMDTGSGTIIAGDIINIADDNPDYNYVVKTALADGSLVIQDPGLMSAVADGKDVTLAANYVANMAFARSAIHLVTRAPAMPSGGDAASDVMEVTDPVSGLAFQVAMYKQYRRVKYEVGLAWGVKAIKPEHIALLIG